jgi:hypothetical protein
MQVWIVAAYRSKRATFPFPSKILAYLHSIKAQPEDTAADLVEGNAPSIDFQGGMQEIAP